MKKIEMLDALVRLAGELGYRVRQDWIGGTSGGFVELRGERWLFLDLSLDPTEQLEQIGRALANDPRVAEAGADPELREYLASLSADSPA